MKGDIRDEERHGRETETRTLPTPAFATFISLVVSTPTSYSDTARET